MKLPSHAECLELLATYRTPLHVVKHCFMVNVVGMFVARKLEKAGQEIDLEVVDRATILHDMLRVVNFDTFSPSHFIQTITNEDLEKWHEQKRLYGNLHHGTAARKELEKLGYKELGKVVEAHRASAIHGKKAKLDSLEKQCLYYADKRVAHTKIVTIAGRFAEWESRHGWSEDKKREGGLEKAKVLALEKELMELARLKPADLQSLVV